VRLTVTRSGETSREVSVIIADYAPAVFRYQRPDGVVDPIITHADGRLVSPGNPARAGEILIVYATGIGALNNAPPTGEAATADPLVTSRQEPVLTVSGRTSSALARVLFAGLTPGFAGLVQINFELPAALPDGPLNLIIRFQDVRFVDSVPLSVQ
jgi:uncharacterized protein (TIGR03437 family)